MMHLCSTSILDPSSVDLYNQAPEPQLLRNGLQMSEKDRALCLFKLHISYV